MRASTFTASKLVMLSMVLSSAPIDTGSAPRLLNASKFSTWRASLSLMSLSPILFSLVGMPVNLSVFPLPGQQTVRRFSAASPMMLSGYGLLLAYKRVIVLYFTIYENAHITLIIIWAKVESELFPNLLRQHQSFTLFTGCLIHKHSAYPSSFPQ